MPTTDELRFLASYEGGNRIWDAAVLQDLVHSLEQQKLIELVPGREDAYQLTQLGREALDA